MAFGRKMDGLLEDISKGDMDSDSMAAQKVMAEAIRLNPVAARHALQNVPPMAFRKAQDLAERQKIDMPLQRSMSEKPTDPFSVKDPESGSPFEYDPAADMRNGPKFR